jgi:hypothetical protein
MRTFVLKSQLATGLLVGLAVISACGGHTGNDNVAQGGHAGTGGQIADAGDAGSPLDSGFCNPRTCESLACGDACGCVAVGGYIGSSADIVDCTIQLNPVPLDSTRVVVFADCVLLPRPSSNSVDAGTSWNIDYSIDTARLVFGAEICRQLQMNQNIPICLFSMAGMVC